MVLYQTRFGNIGCRIADREIVQDPSGTISRLGDLVVWNGSSGQKVLAGLETLNEKQDRIEGVVQHIETAQIGMASSLGMLTSLSMASLGIGLLSAVHMGYRVRALDARMASIGEKLSDILAILKDKELVNLMGAVATSKNTSGTGRANTLTIPSGTAVERYSCIRNCSNGKWRSMPTRWAEPARALLCARRDCASPDPDLPRQATDGSRLSEIGGTNLF